MVSADSKRSKSSGKPFGREVLRTLDLTLFANETTDEALNRLPVSFR